MYQHHLKRPFDIAVSLLLLITLFPLLALTALLIKIFDPGPIFFRQVRVGQNSKSFTILKFRSMPVNTGDFSSDMLHKVELTWIGKILRRTNIDEIPQLLNILFGDMSLIGPRPSLLTQTELIQMRRNKGVFLLRPGLTGWAQVHAFDGMSVYDKVNFDKFYVDSLSFRLDVLILLKTIMYIFRSQPVY